MSFMNYVVLMGGLTRDPELRHTGGGQAICKFSLVVADVYRYKARIHAPWMWIPGAGRARRRQNNLPGYVAYRNV